MRDSISRFGRKGDARRKDLLTRLIAGDPAKGTEPLSDKEISDEISNFIFAGTHTTAVTMAYLLYELASNPKWQERVRLELKEAGSSDTKILYQTLQGLPVLQACIHESMRLHPPVGSGLPRVTPPHGTSIDGVFVPGGVSSA